MSKYKPYITHLDEKKVLEVPFTKMKERIDICKNCYAYNAEKGSCKINGTVVKSFARIKSGCCPNGFWSSYYGD